MSHNRTYLDHNASSPLRPEARAAMLAALDHVGNPSSVHLEGRKARAIVEEARTKVAALVGANSSEVHFTSGGTEANNWVFARRWSSVYLAPGLEHDAVVAPAGGSGARIVELSVGPDGRISSFPRVVDGVRGAMISLQLANNETGIIQPVAEMAAFARHNGFAVHTDAVQAAGRIPTDMREIGVDFLSLSAHKIGGPKGVGALVIRDGVELPAFISGGGQEQRRRAGTENTVAIAGFGAAAEAALRDLSSTQSTQVLRDRLEREVLAITPEIQIVGADSPRIPNTSCLALPGAKAETLVIALDLAGIAVSAGAACSSGKVAQSRVLTAMSLPQDLARAAIRVSLGWDTTAADIDAFLDAWRRVAAKRDARRAHAA